MAVLTTLLQLLLVISSKIKDVLSDEVCGHPHGMMGGKIVGGYDVGYYKYPWFVSMTQSNSPMCGATLISKKTVVTAAHCYDQHSDDPSELANLYVLKIGAYNICDTSEATQKSFKVQKVYVHERYKKEDPFFDIALLILNEPAEGFEPVCLPTKAFDTKTRPWDGVVTGFGVLKYQGLDTSCVQREARVRVYPDKDCKDMISRVDSEIKNFQHAFCAGYLEGGVDACQGDSGGPLMVLQTDSRIELLGITSFGYKCAMKDLLGIYTDVSHFLDWIKEKSNLPITSEVTSTPVTAATSQATGSPPEVTTAVTAITTEESDSDDDDDQNGSKSQESTTSGAGFTSTPPAGEDSTDDSNILDDDTNTTQTEDDSDEDERARHMKRSHSKRKKFDAHKHHVKQNQYKKAHKEKKEKKEEVHKHRLNKISHAVRTKTFYELLRKNGKIHDNAVNRNKHHKHVIRKRHRKQAKAVNAEMNCTN